jgi:hypothetical protein
MDFVLKWKLVMGKSCINYAMIGADSRKTFVLCLRLMESIYTEVYTGSVYKYIRNCSCAREYET